MDRRVQPQLGHLDAERSRSKRTISLLCEGIFRNMRTERAIVRWPATGIQIKEGRHL